MILLRADANSKIGLGHLTRSLALAEMLKTDIACIAAIQSPSDLLQIEISKTCRELLILPETDKLNEEARSIVQQFPQPATIVIDGYHFTTDYQKIFKDAGWKVVCIDDLHEIHFVADIVINHSEGIHPCDYSCEAYTKLCIGTEYALLRPSFLEAARQKDFSEKRNTTLICMGGADPQNHTLKILLKCHQIAPNEQYAIVLGSAYLHRDELNNFLEKSALSIEIYSNLSAEAMANLMKTCSKAILPPSGISYEYASVGGEMYILQTADNQKYICKALIEKNIAFPFSSFGEVLNEEKILQKSQQAHFFAGKSAENLRTLLLN